MIREKFFTDVIITYKELLSTPEGKDLPLRDYCRTRHVAYRDFIKWASTSKDAAGLPEIVKLKKKSSKASASRKPSAVSITVKTPHLYPLKIPDSSLTEETYAPEIPAILRGIKIIFPGGTSISIREGSGREIAHIIQSVNL